MWYTPKCQEAMEIADGRSVRDTGREVKRTYRLTLDIDKLILLPGTDCQERELEKNLKKFLTNSRSCGIIQSVKMNIELFKSNSEQ